MHQRFVPAGWVPPQQQQQLFAQPAPFIAPPQPFVPPPAAARGPGVQIGFDYSRFPPPPPRGGNPLALTPVFEHADDMGTMDTTW